jgi:hypothetical protein
MSLQDGQADNGPGDFDDLAQFLVDNPEADTEDESQPSEESPEDNSEEQTEDAPADEEAEDAESEKPKEQTSGLKFKVPVKGEDGSDTTIEVDEKELIAGYQRHADYTRKTQDLANREREVTQQVAAKLEEGRDHYLQQAQLARAAVLQLAGLKSPQEMAQLAQTDPAAWVAESQRANAIQSVLSQLEQGMTHEQQLAQAKQQEEAQREISRAWGVLGQQGIDKPKLVEIYDKVSTKYGIPKGMLEGLTNPQAVLIMRDALAYQGLKDKKAQVTAKVKEAPKLPPQRQSVPKNEQRNQQLNKRFATGKAKLGDLAAFIANNDL